MNNKVKDLLPTSTLIIFAEMLQVALCEVNTRRAVQKGLNISNGEVIEYRDAVEQFMRAVNAMGPELMKIIAAEEGSPTADLTIQLDQHLDALSFLITIEVARLVLGDPARSGWVLELLGLPEEDANETRQRLDRLMAAIRSNERQIPQGPQNIPALESQSGKWVICGAETKDLEDGPLYWSEESGWVDLESADTFSDREKESLSQPIGGEWVDRTSIRQGKHA